MGASIAEEAMDTSTVSQPVTVCRPAMQPHSTGIPPNFHMHRWDESWVVFCENYKAQIPEALYCVKNTNQEIKPS